MSNIWSEFVADLGDEMAALVRDELVAGWHAKAALAATRQARIKEATDRIEHCSIEGIGQHTMSVDADVYHAWEAAEPGCWKDKGFRDDFKKRFPETAVNYTARKPMVGYRPSQITGICP